MQVESKEQTGSIWCFRVQNKLIKKIKIRSLEKSSKVNESDCYLPTIRLVNLNHRGKTNKQMKSQYISDCHKTKKKNQNKKQKALNKFYAKDVTYNSSGNMGVSGC